MVIKMQVISFGDLYCDYYIKNGKDIYVSGGKSDANILVNLSRYFKCAYFGVCGNDSEGSFRRIRRNLFVTDPCRRPDDVCRDISGTCRRIHQDVQDDQ